ncbi:hypothetical protein ACFE04_031602 [Oxalis oulophora]
MATTPPLPSPSPSASASGGLRSGNREGTAKAIVADQISQTVQSTSNLLHLMQQSSPSNAQLLKLSKNLLDKTSTIKNTSQMLHQMPQVISSLDAHLERGLQSVPHLQTVDQLLANIKTSQLDALSHAHLPQKNFAAPCLDSFVPLSQIGNRAWTSTPRKRRVTMKLFIEDLSARLGMTLSKVQNTETLNLVNYLMHVPASNTPKNFVH